MSLLQRLNALHRKAMIGGGLIVALGIFVVAIASGYPIGQINRFGPGFYPVVLGVVAIGLGIAILFENQEVVSDFIPPPVLSVVAVAGGMLAFALAIEPLGVVAATFALVLITAFGQDRYRPVATVATAVVLSTVAVVLFVHTLRMPMKAFPWS
jgi:hypothetical protein